MLELTIDEEKQLRKAIKRIPREYEKETKKAVNKAATATRKIGMDRTFKRYRIKKKELSSNVKKQTAKISNLEAKISVTGYRIPIYKLKLNDYRATFQRQEDGDALIRVSVLKNSALKDIPDKEGRSKPFITVFKSGHMGVFRTLKGKKTSSGKPKLEEIFTVSAAEMFAHEENINKMREEADKVMVQAYKIMLERGL